MQQSYWDLDSILADSTRLPCHLQLDVPGLGHLQGESGGDEQGRLRKNTRVELPYWLAELLSLHDVVQLSFPRQYSARVRNALDADPRSVRLRELNGWWYAVGARLVSLMESPQLADTLAKTYTSRLTPIYSAAQHLSSTSRSEDDGGLGSANGVSTHALELAGEGGLESSTGMSPEMIDFVNGLEEDERSCESRQVARLRLHSKLTCGCFIL